jgi:7-carboxy-7-deazaguanine synthase
VSQEALERTTATPIGALNKLSTLRITEIFCSLQGEALSVGLPTTFIRLTGCPLRCTYCDTTYSFHGGSRWSLDAIVERVAELGVPNVCVTGGEPLAQKQCTELLRLLCDSGYAVSLETSGAIDILGVDARVSRVVDIKTPDSGECTRNRWENLDTLLPHDQVKFVIGSRADYEWAVARLREHGIDKRCTVLFSPEHPRLAPRDLADWIVADRLPVRFQMQMHKLLWGDTPGR